ncbi:MAG TPA: Uma2 family endonuclease [Roseiflexaceae bacterium]|nr:Uma2 family endonuclease [Roseiflexaceae bacterium]
MSAQPTPFLTEADYLERERASITKHEYYAGAIFAMTGASEAHNLIASNVNAALHGQLRTRPCRLYPSDMRVKVSQTGLITYPDITVVCGGPVFHDPDKRDTLLNPTVLIEILSPSTERYDRGLKFQNYRTLASLQEYVLIAQDKLYVEHYIRHADIQWLLSEAHAADAVVDLSSIGCTLKLADIYEKIDLPDASPPHLPRDTPPE